MLTQRSSFSCRSQGSVWWSHFHYHVTTDFPEYTCPATRPPTNGPDSWLEGNMNRKYEDRDHCSLLYFYTVHTVLFQSRTTLFSSYCFITFSVIHYLGLVDFNELETMLFVKMFLLFTHQQFFFSFDIFHNVSTKYF